MSSPAPTLARAARRSVIILVALGVTSAATLTGCSGGTGDAAAPSASASPPPKGAVTRAQAAKIVDNYVAVNNKANGTRNAKLLGTVESGQVHEQSKGDYATFGTWTKADQSDYEKPFSYRDREYYIPADEDWFAVKATASGSKTPALLVFGKEGSSWKLMSAVYSDAPIPTIDTSNHGLATAVAPSTRVGTLAPNDVGPAFEDLYVTGGKKAGAAISHTTSPAKDALKLYKDRTKGKLAKWATKKFFAKDPAYKETYALRLADGGLLAVIPTSHTQEQMLKPQYMSSFQITPDDEEAVYNPAKRVVITDTFQGMALAVLPKSGKPSVIAYEYGMTDSK
ncbi:MULTISPECIES: hypothetical protein [unclassified Streptomyces]|uniref:hypothetical protein n=1 Tax=unclassified Streptomyces TaxID=2593676 RepID=UPI0022540323|nr:MULTISPECIES: hypothetical protein [unclassified Streptomyces]MCX5293740.1 hypothetical protein [Streptomyces sp. NBC_00183]